MTRTVSVVVNTFNRARSLEITLESLRALDHPDLEVVVVNGPSEDGTDELLDAYTGQIKVGQCQLPNLSASRNVGIALAAGEFVAFIDDDAYPDPAWIDDLLVAFDDVEVAAAGGPVFDHTGASFQARASVASRMGDSWALLDRVPGDEFDSPYSDRFVYTMGTNSLIRRDLLVAIGGFDEEYEYYLDEADVCRRLVNLGYVVRAMERGFVYHKFLPSEMRSADRANRNRYPVVKNRMYFALRHAAESSSMFDLQQSFAAFVDIQRADIAAHVAGGRFGAADVVRFEEDVRRAFDDARAHAAEPSRTRDRAWFESQSAAFMPYPRRVPAGGKLHICFLVQEYPPDPVSGIARFVHSLAVELASKGHVVRVLTQGEDHDRVDLERGVWVHRLVVRPHERPAGFGLPQHLWDHSATLFDELRRISSTRPIDVVQSPNWDVEGIATHLDGGFLSVLSLHTPVRTVGALDSRVSVDHPGNRQIAAVEQRLFEESDGFLANTPSVVGEIERRYGVTLPSERLATIAHGLLDEPDFGRSGTRSDGREILFVGRLEPRKGIDVLLAALPTVLDSFPDARAVIVGQDAATPDGGSYEAQFRRSEFGRRAAGRVQFLGLVAESELPALYANCDVFVAPSRYESFGLVVLEAMRAGKPVVASDVGGMASIVETGRSGLLVPPDDAAALAGALTDLLGDPDRCRTMGHLGRQLFVERYSAERMADETERFYRRLIADRASGWPGRYDIAPPGWPDLSPALRCQRCGAPVLVRATVQTVEGRVKSGSIWCPACVAATAEIEFFKYDFHAAPPSEVATTEPRTVPVLGECRLDGDDPRVRLGGDWHDNGRYRWCDGSGGATVTVELACTDAQVRLLRHQWGGEVELRVDGVRVATVDLFQPDGSQVIAVPLVEDVPLRRRQFEVRATGECHLNAAGRQVYFEEFVALGPLGPVFGPPYPINRGNPYSPVILRYLERTPPDELVLELGGGDRRTARPGHVNFEYLDYELADAYGDIHSLPFADDVFGLVCSQAVFEHVRDPFQAAQELTRVTRPGGLIITEVAFLQPLHAVPYHYFNMTGWGVEALFPSCEVVESDWFGPLSETVERLLRVANLTDKVPPERLAAIQKEFVAFDELMSHDDLKAVASGVYLVVRKPVAPLHS